MALTQHPCDEDPKPQEVCIHLEVEPPRAWYYRIFPNSRTLVILLQVNPVFGDEPIFFVKVIMKLKTLLSSHGLQFSVLDIVVGCAI